MLLFLHYQMLFLQMLGSAVSCNGAHYGAPTAHGWNERSVCAHGLDERSVCAHGLDERFFCAHGRTFFCVTLACLGVVCRQRGLKKNHGHDSHDTAKLASTPLRAHLPTSTSTVHATISTIAMWRRSTTRMRVGGAGQSCRASTEVTSGTVAWYLDPTRIFMCS